MADKSKIQWTESTWNVITGCTKISDGCLNCYITGTPPFRMAGRKFDGPGIGATTGVTLHPDRLETPLRWKKPRMVFVNSLADLFHEDVPDGFIAQVWDVMARCPQHTFQILTKRHARMRSLLRKWSPITGATPWVHTGPWPLPNVWLGVSVESQQWAIARVPALLETPAAVRWISAEPLLGPVLLHDDWIGADPFRRDEPSLDWVVCGGESGPGARLMDLEWSRSLVRQCRDAKTAVFVKQLGSVWAKDIHVGGRSLAAQGDRKGGDWTHWPVDLRAREFPETRPAEVTT
ncbi:phage Gp37/Gp68 family protein [Streptosporangium sp. NPDC051023]|uniref:DUF5131 family protein n=1 Tax=Streptosporangium sp. NPDC051023 TaxID=3155410 RepID=UPI00344E52C5